MGLDIKYLERRLAFDLRCSWQCRLLAYVRREPASIVVLSILGHVFDAVPLQAAMAAVDPDWVIKAPFICTAAKVAKSGAIIADVVWQDNEPPTKDEIVYESELALRNRFRLVADELKLLDWERIELFTCIKLWIVADQRLDPTMDPQDPDAKRLVH